MGYPNAYSKIEKGRGRDFSQFGPVYFKEVTDVEYSILAPGRETMGDHGKIVEINNAAQVTVTLPNNVPPGFHCVIQKTGAGNVVLSAEGTLRAENNFTTIITQNKCITIIKRDATIWVAIGLEI